MAEMKAGEAFAIKRSLLKAIDAASSDPTKIKSAVQKAKDAIELGIVSESIISRVHGLCTFHKNCREHYIDAENELKKFFAAKYRKQFFNEIKAKIDEREKTNSEKKYYEEIKGLLEGLENDVASYLYRESFLYCTAVEWEIFDAWDYFIKIGEAGIRNSVNQTERRWIFGQIFLNHPNEQISKDAALAAVQMAMNYRVDKDISSIKGTAVLGVKITESIADFLSGPTAWLIRLHRSSHSEKDFAAAFLTDFIMKSECLYESTLSLMETVRLLNSSFLEKIEREHSSYDIKLYALALIEMWDSRPVREGDLDDKILKFHPVHEENPEMQEWKGLIENRRN